MGSPLLLEEVLVRHPKLRLFIENAWYPAGDVRIGSDALAGEDRRSN
jgi:hypothetical protein